MCFISVEGYNWVEVTVYIKNLVVLCKELKRKLTRESLINSFKNRARLQEDRENNSSK